MIRWITACALGLSAPALAQEITDCTFENTSATELAEPWEEYSRDLGDTGVRIAAFTAPSLRFRLMILSPWDNEWRQCVMVLDSAGQGFAGLDVSALTFKHRSTSELVVQMPAVRWLPQTDTEADAILQITLDLETGEITPLFQ